MNPIVINKNSWHYWIVEHITGIDSLNTDICEYSKKVFVGFLILLVISAVILFSSIVIVAGIIGALRLFNILHGEPTSLEGFGLGIDSTILFLILGKLISNFLDKENESLHDAKAPPKANFIKLAYRSWKDKYCIKVKIQ